MNSLIGYINDKMKITLTYAISREDVAESDKGYQSQNYGMTTATYENYPRARVLYDYDAQAPGDLTMRAGDIVIVLENEDEQGWWQGTINNKTGLFPSTYVEVLYDRNDNNNNNNNNYNMQNNNYNYNMSNNMSNNNNNNNNQMNVNNNKIGEPVEGDILVARFAYTTGGSEELSFQVGDHITLIDKDGSGWWLGKLEKSGVVGWFAPDLTAPLKNALSPKSPSKNQNISNNQTNSNQSNASNRGGVASMKPQTNNITPKTTRNQPTNTQSHAQKTVSSANTGTPASPRNAGGGKWWISPVLYSFDDLKNKRYGDDVNAQKLEVLFFLFVL